MANTKQSVDADSNSDVIIIGSGMAGLTAGALLAQRGLKVRILEQNWLPGGCSSSYPRHHFVFEAGATTLVGLDEHMPLRYLVEQTGIQIDAWKLKIPMQVHLANGRVLTRHENLDEWISEAESTFGPKGQRAFWETCFKVSQFVWKNSLKQLAFPPTRMRDLLAAARNASFQQVRHLPDAFRSTEALLRKHGLADNPEFRAFVDEQLLITAQNFAPEVNVLFGAAALCYTNYSNYYVPGGMVNLVNPIVNYLKEQGSEVKLRTPVTAVHREKDGYRVDTKKSGSFRARYLLSAIPLNNTLPLFNGQLEGKFENKLMRSGELRSAFQMGIAFKRHRDFEVIHHQIHLSPQLPEIDASSIFLSLSHPKDETRCAPDEAVASISTHVFDPDNSLIENKALLEAEIIQVLEEKDMLKKENILYQHASTPGAWQKWTAREWGFVGGYPQYLKIKPWMMKDARLDGQRAYICGDSTYPGQGIPGACLSGIIAVEKMRLDHRI